MITEKRFALSHHAFWQSAIPMAPAYVRRCNATVESFAGRMRSKSDDNRGVTNELAFRLYCEASRRKVQVPALPSAAVRAASTEAVSFIRRFREFGREPVRPPTRLAVEEAKRLAGRIALFERSQRAKEAIALPTFPGCGWVDECSGDLLLDDMLCEVKAGMGRFKGRDLRQLLVYVALNRMARRYAITSVCLVNPRLGVFWSEEIEELCRELSGTSSTELIAEIVTYISQPQWRDEAV